MLDRNSKKFMNYLKSQPNYEIEWDSDVPDKFGDWDKLRILIRYLMSLGYIESTYYSNGTSRGLQLTYMGVNWKKFKRQQLLKYLEEKWIDFFALLISFMALVISAISILTKVPC